MSRPKTLSERRAELALAEGVVAANAMLTRSQTLVAAERQFTFCWGDDGYDPLRQEFVALYSSEEDYKIAFHLNEIPESSIASPDEFSGLSRTQIPFEHSGDLSCDGTVFVVFSTHYQKLLNYDGEEYNRHSTYHVDGSGQPLRAFSSWEGARTFESSQTRRLIETGNYSKNICEYGVEFEDFTSLSAAVFWNEVRNLGIDIRRPFEEPTPCIYQLNPFVFPCGRAHPFTTGAKADAEAVKLSLTLLRLLDRVHLHKTLKMKVEHYYKFR